VFTDLHNPTSARWRAGEAGALTALAERHGFHLLCDETFRDADSDRPCGTAASLGPLWLSTSSLTKSYGLGGLRLGWVAGSPDVLERCAAARRAISVEPAHASVSAACELLPRLDTLRARGHAILRRNAEAWTAFTRRLGALSSATEPLGTVVWCRVGQGSAGDQLSDYALAHHGVAVTPGRFFGDSGCVRVGLGGAAPGYDRAIEALGTAYQEWSAVVETGGGRA
jgi:aspartate/methionine/tyrosine aminotransferase